MEIWDAYDIDETIAYKWVSKDEFLDMNKWWCIV